MFYAIYKITNLLDGKIYIGSHKTKKLDDNYMGSGKYLKAAQKKYGMENFKKEILFVFDNPEDMYAKEAELVNVEFLITENTYNLKVGGFGGWDYINGDETSRIEKNRKARKSATNTMIQKYGKDFSCKIGKMGGLASSSKSSRDKARQTMIERLGISHVNEVLARATQKAKEKNASLMWITDEFKDKKIPKLELIPFGWRRGRKKKS